MDKTEKNEQPKLQDEVSAKYDLVGTTPGKHRFADFGELDLTRITAKDAKSLVAAGFPYLKLKSKDAPPEENVPATKGAAK